MNRIISTVSHWLQTCLCHLALALPMVAQAGPDLAPGNFYAFMPSQRSTLVAHIRNLGDVTAFVSLQLAELTFDNQGQAEEQPLETKAGLDRALVVTPPRLILPAQGAGQVRVIYRGPRDRERYFRLRYVPVAPEAVNDFALQPEEARAYSDTLRAGVGILKAVGTLVIVPPANARYATRLVPGAHGLRIVNEGNATVSVVGARYCEVVTDRCELGGALHIRPGQQAEVARRPGQVYRFELQEGRMLTRHSYPE